MQLIINGVELPPREEVEVLALWIKRRRAVPEHRARYRKPRPVLEPDQLDDRRV